MTNAEALPLPPAADLDVFLIGMRRSGIHGVISWLLPHFSGVTRLVNDPPFTAGQGHGPFEGQPLRHYFTHGGRTAEIVLPHERASLLEEAVRETSRRFASQAPAWLRPVASSVLRKYRRHVQGTFLRPAAFPYEGSDNFVPVNTNLFVLENITPEEFASVYPRWRAEDYTDFLRMQGLAPSSRTVILLLLRDPWNQLASVMKLAPLAPPRPVAPEAFKATWLAYAREFAGLTRLLPPYGEVVPVLYSHWFRRPEYRRELAARLGVNATDAGLHVVSSFGGGSSFDGRSLSGKAQEMKVEERWKAYADHPLMRDICGDAQVRTLAHELTGQPVPDLKG